MDKTKDKAYNVIKEMALNNYQWSNENSQPKRVGGKLELDAVYMLSAKVDAMYRKLDWLNVNSTSSSTPSSTCEIYASVDHLTVNRQVGSPFTLDFNKSVNYVNNSNPRSINDPFLNTYNLD